MQRGKERGYVPVGSFVVFCFDKSGVVSLPSVGLLAKAASWVELEVKATQGPVNMWGTL